MIVIASDAIGAVVIVIDAFIFVVILVHRTGSPSPPERLCIPCHPAGWVRLLVRLFRAFVFSFSWACSCCPFMPIHSLILVHRCSPKSSVGGHHHSAVGGGGGGGGGGSNLGESYSRKVFVGGLPPDIDEEEITASFRRFGALVVDWPHKAESKSYFPPKGYAFLLFQVRDTLYCK